jgi:uncharacterized protein
MKLHLSSSQGVHSITAYTDAHVEVNGTRYTRSLIVLPERVLPDWPIRAFAELQSEHFQQLLDQRPEIVLLGTGLRHRFPHPSLYAGLLQLGIGVEVMTTAAACRTYNIIAAEGRRAAAALIIEAA